MPSVLGPSLVCGQGVKTIVEMVVHTRLDCTIGSASLMRICAAHAAHHASHRSAFGHARLSDAPMMRAVLADLAVETEAATALWARLARAFDGAADDAHERAIKRIATAVGKYWVCKRAPLVAFEAMECLGGNVRTRRGSLSHLGLALCSDLSNLIGLWRCGL